MNLNIPHPLFNYLQNSSTMQNYKVTIIFLDSYIIADKSAFKAAIHHSIKEVVFTCGSEFSFFDFFTLDTNLIPFTTEKVMIKKCFSVAYNTGLSTLINFISSEITPIKKELNGFALRIITQKKHDQNLKHGKQNDYIFIFK